MNKVFNSVGANRPSRSVFDLSYEKKFTCDMGQLIPIMCDECIPGDIFQIGNEIVIRFQPLVAPVLHEINAYVHYFFVPYRILWNHWEEFITGGIDGEYAEPVPRWISPTTTVGSLWDYLGFPTGITPEGAYPLNFPKYAYNTIYNEFYRDETLITETSENSEIIQKRCWEKDYFTSSLPWQQRGTAPSLPISGTTSAVWPASNLANQFTFVGNNVLNVPFNAETKSTLENNTVDLASATTFNVADLRLAFQIQKWLERNARGGARYTEFLQSHYGVNPRDDRLQRPEYIGGSKSGIVVSEVLQTSSTDVTSPQGNLAGHGITADRSFVGRYRALEFGLIMGIMSIMPRTAYQQGIDRQWLRTTKYDFPFPEFVNLSEQAIERAEIYATNVEAENKTIFGYQGRYNECRIKRNMVCGHMRDTFDYWHLGRKFATPPTLNKSFIECNPSKRIFAVQDEHTMIVNIGNRIKAIRPLPIMSNPGQIDH